MSKKASKTLIGVFVVTAVGIAVAAVIIFGAGNIFRERELLVAFFEGSVKGLRTGAPVTFRGVPIGQVKSIRVVYNRKDLSFWIPVILELETDKIDAMGAFTVEPKEDQAEEILVDLGLRAQLDIQSIVTGQLYVNLDFFPDKPAHFVKHELPDLDIPYEEIPTIKTPLQEIGDVIEDFPIKETVADIRRTLKGIERVVNSPELQSGISEFGKALMEVRQLVVDIDDRLKGLSGSVEDILAEATELVNNLNVRIDDLAESAEETLADARDLIDSADGSVEKAGELLNELKKEIEPVASKVQSTLASSERSFDQAEKTLEAVEEAAMNSGPLKYRIEQTLDEIRSAARSVRALADYLEKHPDSLLRGKSSRGNR